MTRRGKILRDTSQGAGRLSANGQQYDFLLEEHWRSDIPPKTGMSVEFEIDNNDRVISVTAVDDLQVTKELAKQNAMKLLEIGKVQGGSLVRQAIARFGLSFLLAMIVLCAAWFYFSAINVRVLGEYAEKITFWQILGVLNSDSIMDGLKGLKHGTGLYGLVGAAALAAPFLPYFWSDRRAHLAHCAPLIFMVFVAVSIYLSIHGSFANMESAGKQFGGEQAAVFAREMAEQMATAVQKAISFGMGTYLSLTASGLLAFRGITKFIQTKTQPV